MNSIRIDRIFVARGLGTRRDIHRMIKAGRVHVNGVVVRKKDSKFPPDITIEFDGEPILSLPIVIVWHKPLDVVSTLRDPLGRRDLSSVLPIDWRQQFHPVGRLDQETTGLLLFSRSGQLTQWLLHPRRGIEGAIELRWRYTDPSLVDKLAQGVETSLGTFPHESNP